MLPENIPEIFPPTSSRVGAILAIWDESFGPVLLDAKPRTFFSKEEINATDLMVQIFTSAQSVFGGIEFQKTSFILPLHYVHLKTKLFFDFKEDPNVRGGRMPILVAIFSDIEVKDTFFDFFDVPVERAISNYKEEEIKAIDEIIQNFNEYLSNETIIKESSFNLEEYGIEMARRDWTLAKKAFEKNDFKTSQILAIKAGMRFVIEPHYRDAGKAFRLAGEIALGLQDYPVAREYFDIAKKSFIDAGDLDRAATSEYFQGFASLRMENYAEALSAINNVRDKLQETPLAPEIEQNLAEIYQNLGEFEKARNAFRDAIERYESQQNHRMLGELATDYGDFLVTQYLKGEIQQHGGRIRISNECEVILDEIIAMYNLSAHSWQALNNKYDEAIVYESLAKALDISGFLERSNESYQKAYEIFKEIGEPVRAINNLVNIGNNYGQLGNIEKAFEIYSNAFHEFRGEGVELLDVEVLDSLFFSDESDEKRIPTNGDVEPKFIDEDMFTIVRQNPELARKFIPLLELAGDESMRARSFIEAAKIFERAFELSHFVDNIDLALKLKRDTMRSYLYAAGQFHEFARMNFHYEHEFKVAQKYALLSLQWFMSALLFSSKEKREKILSQVRQGFGFTKRLLQSSPRDKISKNALKRFERLYSNYKKITRHIDRLEEVWEEIYEEIRLKKAEFE